MKKFKLVFSLVASLVVLFLISTAAFAEVGVTANAVYDLSTGMVVISGTVDDTYLKTVRIVVYRPGYTKEMVTNGTATIDQAISNIDEAPVAFGTFEYKYKPTIIDTTGIYTAYINISDSQIEECTFFYGPTDGVWEALQAAAAKTDAEKLTEFSKYADYFTASCDVFGMLDNNGKNNVIIETISNTDYTDVAEFKDNLNDNSVEYLFKNTKKSDDIKYLIENYSEELAIDLNGKTYTNYIAQTPAYIEDLYSMIAQQSYKASDTPNVAVGKAITMTALNKIVSYGQIATITDLNSSLLNIGFSAYSKLDGKSKVLKVLYDNKAYMLTSCEAFKQKWDAAVSDEKNAEVDPNPGNGGGGGGGGGGAGPSTGVVTGGESGAGSNVDSNPSTGVTVENPGATDNALFNDLDSAGWAKDAIITLAKADILKGKADMIFSPNDNVTREEFLKMLFLCATLKVNDSAVTTFTDVDKNEWYYGYIATAQEMGLVSGVDDNMFGIGQCITREDMAVMVIRAVSKLGVDLVMPNEKKVFTDNVKLSGYALESVYAMQKAGIINGYDNGSFLPQAFATRAEAAQIIYKLTNLFVH